MKKIKFTKETLALLLILILSAVLNFANIAIEGYANGYYAAGVKSMFMNLKNFFFVSFDPAGFVTIDKPPLGFWIQTISAKIFGFSGWSIILPQALAGVISVGLIYHLVKRSFGSIAGLVSALCLAITPVFVAASRNNTLDNLLLVTLLFSCLALLKAAEKGKIKYLIISLVLIGIGFNIKMLQAYMIAPAIYITYLLSSIIPLKNRIKHLIIGTVVLFTVSLFWAVVVDLVPAQNRPFVGSSTNNTVKELIFGHNGLNRIIGGSGTPGSRTSGKDGQENNTPKAQIDGTSSATKNIENKNQANTPSESNEGYKMPGNPPSVNGQDPAQREFGPNGGNMQPPNMGGRGDGQGRLAGSFGAETQAGITRLFSKNILSDQIAWFLPLAILGFIAAAIKEKLRFPFDNEKKLSLILWIAWLVPEFIYFSYTKGLFHPYYLTMMAPPIAALTGIGITVMWKLYKEGGWKSWVLPVAFIIDGLTQLLMLSYFNNISSAIKGLIIVSLILCFVCSIVLGIANLVKNKDAGSEDNNDELKQSKIIKFKKALVTVAFVGILVTPAIGASAPIYNKLNSTIPSAGLELFSSNKTPNFGDRGSNNANTKLIEFLQSNRTNEKYLLVVSSASEAQDIIINTGESVMALGGFSGNDKILTLDQFKEMVIKGEVRYVMLGGMGGRGSSSDIMNWVKENGKVLLESQWKDVNQSNGKIKNSDAEKKSTDSENQEMGRPGEMNSQQLYDLKDSN